MGYPNNWKPSTEFYIGDDRFRYKLGTAGNNVLICFGVNPSTATEDKPDATMRQLIKVCQKFGYDSYIMLNPCPIRSSSPDKLPTEETFAESFQKNMDYIEEVFAKYPGATALASWGNAIDSRLYLKNAVCKIYATSKKYNIQWNHYSSMTQKGHPRHLLLRDFSQAQREQALLEPLDMERYTDSLNLQSVDNAN